MKKRDRDADSIFFGQAEILSDKACVVEQIDVSEQDTFGRAGCAGGVQDAGCFFGVRPANNTVGLSQKFRPLGFEGDDVLKLE